LDLIRTFIDIEIAVANETTLFRSNSPVTRMFKYYSKMIGIHYLFDNLAKYIAELEASQKQKHLQKKSESELELMNPGLDFEVDPSKMNSEEDENVNKLQLQLVSQKIFNAIMRSATTMPPAILIICTHLRKVVAQTFPGKDLEYKAISAFLFLRFICPSLAAPHAYGLLPAPPTNEVQRQLILLSKILQNLANGLRFGMKEEFMMKLNDFIDNNMLTLHKFYDHLEVPSHVFPYPFPIPKVVKENALNWLYTHICINFYKLNQEFDSCPDHETGQSVKKKMAQLLDTAGPPPEKKKVAT